MTHLVWPDHDNRSPSSNASRTQTPWKPVNNRWKNDVRAKNSLFPKSIQYNVTGKSSNKFQLDFHGKQTVDQANPDICTIKRFPMSRRLKQFVQQWTRREKQNESYWVRSVIVVGVSGRIRCARRLAALPVGESSWTYINIRPPVNTFAYICIR